MKPVFAYSLATVLVLVTVPIYRFMLDRRSSPPSVAVAAPVVHSAGPSGAVPRYSRFEAEADEALMARRARCVAGVVYRTYDHVIEPWPGDVRCQGDPGYVVPR